jgi:ribosomal protein S27E
MCVSPFIKYMLLSVVVGTLVIFAIFFENLFYAIPMMIFAIIQSRVKCPKCGTPILKDTNGWYLFTVRSTCRTCGHDTMLCDEGKK